MDQTGSQEDAALSLSDGGPLRQVRDPGGLESEGLTLRSGNTLRGRLPQTSEMSETQASLESTVTAAQDQSGLSYSESPPVLSPIVTTAEQRRAVLSQYTALTYANRRTTNYRLHHLQNACAGIAQFVSNS